MGVGGGKKRESGGKKLGISIFFFLFAGDGCSISVQLYPLRVFFDYFAS